MNYKEYKEKRLGLKKKIDYHVAQIDYHSASLKSLEQLLRELDLTHSSYRNSLHDEAVTAAKQQVEEFNLDRNEYLKRLNLRKTKSLYEAMIKNFE